jgi:hypothetical protein
LLGPHELDFWSFFQQSLEYLDDKPDPLDRWSQRDIGTLANNFGADPIFPFLGRPFTPFFSWTMRTNRIFESPLRLLIHDQNGLFVSFRGALAFPAHIDLPPAPPYKSSHAPCKTACPVHAFDDGFTMSMAVKNI